MRQARVVFLLILLLCEVSQARVYLWPILLKGRGERTEDQAMELRGNQYPSIGASIAVDDFIFSLESARFEHESSDGNVSIETRYSDVSLWGGYGIFSLDRGTFYVTAGVGSYEQKIESSIASVVARNSSSQKMLTGAGAEFLLETDFRLALAGGARLLWTEDLDLEIIPELYIKIGFGF